MKGDFTRLTFRPANHYSSVRLQQGRVQVDADWNEQVDIQAHLERTATRDLMGRTGAPEVGGGFEIEERGYVGSLRGVALGSSRGYAVGDGGTVVDGIGALWMATTTSTSAILRAVHAVDDTAVWAVGDRGVVMAHVAGGWVRQDTPIAASALRAVHFLPDAKTGWAVGDRGTIIATTTGGANSSTKIGWAYQAAPDDVRVTLRGVHFLDASTGWAVGDRGTILACRAKAWTTQPRPAGLPVTTNLRAVQFVDPNHGWIVGDGGTVLLTTDGGATWTIRTSTDSGVSVNLRAVSFVDASKGWAVGDGATIIATSDGGKTWKPQAPPAGLTATLRGVRVGRSTLATAVGDGGTIIHTQDAGKTWALVEPGGRGMVVSAGRMYVDGILVENDQPMPLTAQPDLPGFVMPDNRPDGRVRSFLFYLDVWERHLTSLERPEIREVALGGPDTATRTKLVSQIRWEEIDRALGRCGGPGWTPTVASRGYMAAQAAPPVASDDTCLVPPGGGYRRLENQLYRVEIHGTDADGKAVFKWSRDNGSVLARLDRIDADQLTVSAPGPDAVAAFDGAPWVEVADEERTLTVAHGDLVRLTSAQAGKLVPVDPAAIQVPGTNPIVRRWDGTGTVQAGWVDLEDGVQIRFESIEDRYRSGDYWLVPARSLTGAVDWPLDENGPRFEPPHGIDHHYAVLAEMRPGGHGFDVSDCRRRFSSLADLSVTRAPEPAVHVMSVSVRSKLEDTVIRNGGTVVVGDIRHGIDIAFDRRVEPLSLSAACRVTIDLPFPMSQGDRSYWEEDAVVGYQPLVLDSMVTADDESNSITWRASSQADFLEKVLDRLVRSSQPARVRAHLRLQGNFIWAADDPTAWLDGDTFGTRRDRYLEDVDLVEAGGRIGGDGRRGGDFLMWFDIVSGA